MQPGTPNFCVRCKAPFTCEPAAIADCACRKIELNEAARMFIRETYSDCLCNNCLASISQSFDDAAKNIFPQAYALIEGVHYYIENESWVFTALYHRLRGNCCGSGCRHCPWRSEQEELNGINRG